MSDSIHIFRQRKIWIPFCASFRFTFLRGQKSEGALPLGEGRKGGALNDSIHLPLAHGEDEYLISHELHIKFIGFFFFYIAIFHLFWYNYCVSFLKEVRTWQFYLLNGMKKSI